MRDGVREGAEYGATMSQHLRALIAARRQRQGQ
jgi:hypothetical protein